MVYLIYIQSNSDIFFIDWEKSKGRLMSKGNDQKGAISPVSVWRTLFVANEWNEIQVSRHLNLELTLVLLLLFLRVLNFEYAATKQPTFHNLEPGETDPIMKFAISTFMWLVIALVQVLFENPLKTHYSMLFDLVSNIDTLKTLSLNL